MKTATPKNIVTEAKKRGLLFIGSTPGLSYDKTFKVFNLDGACVPFKSTYYIMNPATGNVRRFEFAESTGSEWDPKSLWIYADATDEKSGLEIHMSNHIAQGAADNYALAKSL